MDLFLSNRDNKPTHMSSTGKICLFALALICVLSKYYVCVRLGVYIIDCVVLCAYVAYACEHMFACAVRG